MAGDVTRHFPADHGKADQRRILQIALRQDLLQVAAQGTDHRPHPNTEHRPRGPADQDANASICGCARGRAGHHATCLQYRIGFALGLFGVQGELRGGVRVL